MQKLLLLCCTILFASGAALAQSEAPTGAVSAIADPAPAAASPAEPQVTSRLDLTNWQVAFSYQFNEFFMPGRTGTHSSVPPFTANDNGYEVSFTRFLTHWGGLEGDVGQGFGGTSTPQIKDSKVLSRSVGGHDLCPGAVGAYGTLGPCACRFGHGSVFADCHRLRLE